MLDHLAEQPNVAPFIARRMIQRFGVSNPSPTYLRDVAEAFRTGRFNTEVFSGKYGDLAATVAPLVLANSKLEE